MILDPYKYGGIKGLHNFIYKNRDRIEYSKKSQIKHADGIGCFMMHPDAGVSTYNAMKENKEIENPPDILPVKVAINTTNIYDSHSDVHISGLWNKSLKENRMISHIQEHKNGLEYVISDGNDLKAYAKEYSFSEIGFQQYEGKTQLLLFESNVRKDRNEFMHNQYSKGWVNQHSVGMQYVKIATAVDSKDYPEEYKNYKKYIDFVANPEDIRDGYFFAVTEAKAIEGSAVTRGSNNVTPTLSNNVEPTNESHSDKVEPSQDTQRSKIIYHLM